MSFLRPVAMTKIGIVGLKDDQERLLTVLHDLGVVQIEPIGKEALAYVEPERAGETQRLVGEQLIRFRGLKSALPPIRTDRRVQFSSLADVLEATKSIPIDDDVGRLKRAEDAAQTGRKYLADTLALLEAHPYYTDRLEYLSGPYVLAFFGEAKPAVFDSLRAEIPSLADAQFFHAPAKGKTRFLVVVRTEQAEAIGRLAQQRGVTLTPAPRLTGTIAEAIPRLQDELKTVDAGLVELRAKLGAIATQWYPSVAAIEEALSIEAHKLDVYVKLGASRTTFALEGWVPTRNLESVRHAVDQTSAGAAAVYDAPTHDEEAPTLMENPKGIRWFEFFIRFYSIPQSNEWDPTWIFAIAFSVFFGFMLADWGFGLVILLICTWMVLGFPGGKYLPKGIKGFITTIMGPSGMRALAFTLIPGCLIAIGLGLYVNAFFGAPAFCHAPCAHIDLTTEVSLLLGIALIFGVAMVILGFALGALHEYYLGHRMRSLGKVGGIIAALGVYGLFSPILASGTGLAPTAAVWIYVWFGALILGAALLVVGEGVMMGAIGSLETLTHVLSYARLVGILLASIILATFIIQGAYGLIDSGGSLAPLYILGGVVILIFGVGFTVILSAFEPSIQGMRLIFVEHFSKYYEGNGRPFSPFGSARVHTAPMTPAPATVTPTIPP